jgi:hypothetical protein
LEHNPGHLKEIEMIDNAAIGTAMIGLAAARREQALGDEPAPPKERKSRGVAFRSTIADALRYVADSLEPTQRSAEPHRV